MSLSDRDRKIVLALVPIVLLAAFWFLLLSPKREEAASAGQTADQAAGAARPGAQRAARAPPRAPRPTSQPTTARSCASARRSRPASTCRACSCSSTARPRAPTSASPRSRPANARRPPLRRPPQLDGTSSDPRRCGGWRAGPERARWRCRGRQRHRCAAERAGGSDLWPRCRRHPDLDLVGQRRPGRRRGHHRRTAAPTVQPRCAGPRDRAAGARVHRQLLQPRRLLPRREALRARRQRQRRRRRSPGDDRRREVLQRPGAVPAASRPSSTATVYLSPKSEGATAGAIAAGSRRRPHRRRRLRATPSTTPSSPAPAATVTPPSQ